MKKIITNKIVRYFSTLVLITFINGCVTFSVVGHDDVIHPVMNNSEFTDFKPLSCNDKVTDKLIEKHNTKVIGGSKCLA